MSADASAVPPKRTPLYATHVAAGAKMVPFAGYEMPVQYPLGVLKEHLWTREMAGLFDVAHMGLGFLQGPDHATVAKALEALITSSKRLGDKLAVVHAEVYTDDTTTTTAPAVDAYNLSGEPDMWLTDKTGKIMSRFEGAWDQTELDETLDTLVA